MVVSRFNFTHYLTTQSILCAFAVVVLFFCQPSPALSSEDTAVRSLAAGIFANEGLIVSTLLWVGKSRLVTSHSSHANNYVYSIDDPVPIVVICHLQKRLLPQSLQLQGSSGLTHRQMEEKMKIFYDLLHSLTSISEREQQLRAMLTLSDHQDNLELMAVQAVLQELTDNACELVH